MSKRRGPKTRPTSSSVKAEPPAEAPIFDHTTNYARAVIGGIIVAGPHVRAACARHIRDLKDGEERGLFFDVESADRVFRYFPSVLRLAGGQFEGLPFELALLKGCDSGAQHFILGSIFGWKKWSPKFDCYLRRFRRAFIEMGKGNGKSPLAAGIGLYLMISDKEPRAEIYAAAAMKEQAQVLFDDAVAMVDQSPRLRHRVTKRGVEPVEQLSDMATRSRFKPIGKDKRGKSGPRPSAALCDEIHEMPDGVVLELLERGFKWRRQPLLFMITNSGSDRNSICWQQHDTAVKVAHGELELDEMFSYVCALDESDDPLEDPKCWPKANPLIEVTTTSEELAREVRLAKAIPGQANSILRLRFCVWTDAAKARYTRSTIEPCIVDFDPKIHRGKKAFLGLDLADTQDLAAIGACVPTGYKDLPGENGRKARKPTFDVWAECFTPADTLKMRAERDKAPYEQWVKAGFLTQTQGLNVRFDFVAARVAGLVSEYAVRALAYDRYAYRRFQDELSVFKVNVEQWEHPQGGKRRAKPTDEELARAKAQREAPPEGLWFPGSLKAFDEAVFERRIRICKNPVTISAIMSAGSDSDPFGNEWLAKYLSTNRIDALVAIVMAVGAASRVASAPVDLSGFLSRPVIVG